MTKPARSKITFAKNVKRKKISVKWRKISIATKYQVKAVCVNKSITKTTTKTSYTIKKLKRKKTYKIYVRAYNKAGYGKWSKAKKVTIKTIKYICKVQKKQRDYLCRVLKNIFEFEKIYQ